MKTGQIYQDPLTTPETPLAGVSADTLWSYRTQFGYAFTIHCPVEFTDGVWKPDPTSQTALAHPAETVLFVTKKTRNNNGDWLWVGSNIWGANLVNPPLCRTTTLPGVMPYSYCVPITYWGVGGTAYNNQSFEEGGLTGGVAFRKTKKSVVVWADGHAKYQSADQLAAGTNWTKTRSQTSVAATDMTKYVWDKQ